MNGLKMTERDELAYTIANINLKDKSGKYSGFVFDIYAKQIAETLYDIGYRKTFTSELATDMQKAYKEGYKKAAIERDIEIEQLRSKNDSLNKKIAELEQDLIHADENVFYRECAVKFDEDKIKKQAQIDVLNRAKEYAKACQESGYDGIGEHDIDELIKGVKNGYNEK